MLWGVAFALAVEEPPRTVNDQVLGIAADFTTAGPARVCLNDLAVLAPDGSSVQLLYSGIHSGTLRLTSGKSYFDIRVGDAWAEPRDRGSVVARGDGYFIRAHVDEPPLKYLVYRNTEYGFRPTAWIEGPRLRGYPLDKAILRQLEFQRADSTPCDRTYRFGWSVIFGDEPLSEGRSE